MGRGLGLAPSLNKEGEGLVIFHSSGSGRETYDAVFEHPDRLDLDRGDVQAMLRTFADVAHGRDGRSTFTRNGEVLVLRDGRGGQTHDSKELMEIRHFLQRAGAMTIGAVALGAHLMVVIDDCGARVYEVRLRGTVPAGLASYDPHGFAGHLRSAADDTTGRRCEPDCKSFYEALAKTLRGAEQVVIAIGTAPGARGAVNHLFAELRLHHRQLAERVLGTFSIDSPNPSHEQLLESARDFYANHQC
jgi:hypothetical protein